MIELFSENIEAMRGEFIWQNTLARRQTALLYAARDRRIDSERIRGCYRMIKERTDFFSTFRSYVALSEGTLLSLEEDPAAALAQTFAVFNRLMQERFQDSVDSVIAAFQIAAHVSREQQDDVVRRAKDFYDGMRREHPRLIGQESYAFATMLALSGLEVGEGIARMERDYAMLRGELHVGSPLQALTQVLALGGDRADLPGRVLSLRDGLRQRGLRMDREYTLPSLGVLALLPGPVESIADDVAQAYGALRGRRGLGGWSMSKQELLLLTAALTAFAALDDGADGLLTTTLSTSIADIIIAQQTAMIVVVVASSSSAVSLGN
jgi:hypothetical protein